MLCGNVLCVKIKRERDQRERERERDRERKFVSHPCSHGNTQNPKDKRRER
jgi:hypothetical protein